MAAGLKRYRWVVRSALVLSLSVARPGFGVTLPAEQHPGLLFSAEDIETLKVRIQRPPHDQWWQTVLSRAQAVPATFTEERTKARFAKSLAFAYLMTDSTAFAQQAAAIMVDMKFPPRGGDLGEPHNEGEVVALYAVAYDMLHTYLAAVDPTSLAEIRTILAEEAERIRDGIVIHEIDLGFLGSIKIVLNETPDPRDLSVIHLDNWHIRAYGGLGLAAFALADHAGIDGGTPQEWADEAFDLVTRSLVHQIEPTDGGYAEGPFYSRYAADVYLPYLFSLKRLAEVDLFAAIRVERMHDWSVNIRLPNGRRPNTDDGHLDEFYGHYLAAVDADGGVHRWDWENNETGLYVREFSEMDAIILYDDTIVAREPTRGPTIFMPEAGDAVFRSDWSSDATYLLLRGEHGRAREQGLGHEHPDETSFIIYAKGEMLAVDAGYINFGNHHKVNAGSNHSVILVDGAGPPLDLLLGESVNGGNDAYIEQTFKSAFVDYAEVRANYQGVDFRRRVLFPGKEYFVIADEVRGDGNHEYEWRLHGNGGGTSGGTYAREANLARWSRPLAELIAYLPQSPGRQFAEVDDTHSFSFLEEETHNVLRVTESGTDVEFLAIVVPKAIDADDVVLSDPTAEGAEAASVSHSDGREDLAWILAAAADTARIEQQGMAIESDARFGFVRYQSAGLVAMSIMDGTYLTSDLVTPIAASEQLDVSVTFGAGAIEGFVRGPATGFDLTFTLTDSVESLLFAGTEVDGVYDTAGDVFSVSLAGEGDLVIQTTAFTAPAETGDIDPDQIAATARADFDGSEAVDFADLFLFADAFGQPAFGNVARFDLDGSGIVDAGDFSLFADQFGRSTTTGQ